MGALQDAGIDPVAILAGLESSQHADVVQDQVVDEEDVMDVDEEPAPADDEAAKADEVAASPAAGAGPGVPPTGGSQAQGPHAK